MSVELHCEALTADRFTNRCWASAEAASHPLRMALLHLATSVAEAAPHTSATPPLLPEGVEDPEAQPEGEDATARV